MFPAPFEYHRAASVREALGLLKRHGEDAKLLAGGHSLLPMMKLRLAQPAHLIDIGQIRELGAIREEAGRIIVGAAATHAQVESSDLVRSRLGLLAECAGTIGDVQVRNRGTLGGCLAHADPAADYPAALLALEGEVRLEGEAGARTIKAQEFFVDLLTTAIGAGEILTQVALPIPPAGAGWAYLKHPQPASGFAIVGVAALLGVDQRGDCTLARVAITGLAAKAFRATAVEAALAGKPCDTDALRAAASHAAGGVSPMADIHASGEFRSELARVYTKRALERARSRCQS